MVPLFFVYHKIKGTCIIFEFYCSLPYIGAVVLLALGVLSQAFDYIPKTSLAAIIIAAVLYMVDVKILLTIWKIKSELQILDNYNYIYIYIYIYIYRMYL